LLQESFPLWRELEKEAGGQLLTITGALMIGQRTAEVIGGALAAASEHGLVASAGDVAVLDAQAGFLRPEAAVAAMIDRLIALGGEIRRGQVVTKVSSRADGVEVATTSTVEKFDAVVIAAGAWTHELVSLPLTVERQVLAWLEIEKDAHWLRPDRFPVFFRETSELGSIYGFPTLDGVSVKIARHHDGDDASPDAIRRDVTEAELVPLQTFARTYLRGVGERVVRTAVCMYTNTPDRHFAIDLHPADSRIVVISACSGHGFKFAPVIGDIGADLVYEGRTSRDIARFALARFVQPTA
jgi:sarcosine oxidase